MQELINLAECNITMLSVSIHVWNHLMCIKTPCKRIKINSRVNFKINAQILSEKKENRNNHQTPFEVMKRLE